jgi:hypothetical protein
MLLLSTVVWFFLFDINLNVEKKASYCPSMQGWGWLDVDYTCWL